MNTTDSNMYYVFVELGKEMRKRQHNHEQYIENKITASMFRRLGLLLVKIGHKMEQMGYQKTPAIQTK